MNRKWMSGTDIYGGKSGGGVERKLDRVVADENSEYSEYDKVTLDMCDGVEYRAFLPYIVKHQGFCIVS